jgi:hypothetical protein
VAALVARNANEAMVEPAVESAFRGILESGSRFCVGAFGRNLASATVKMCSHKEILQRNFINVVLSIRYAKIMLQ